MNAHPSPGVRNTEGLTLSHPTGHCPLGYLDPQPCPTTSRPPRPAYLGNASPAPCYGNVMEALRWGTAVLLGTVTEQRGGKGLSRDIAMHPVPHVPVPAVTFHPHNPNTHGSTPIPKAAVFGVLLWQGERHYLDTGCWCCRAHRSPARPPRSARSSPALRERGAEFPTVTPRKSAPRGTQCS